MSCRSLLMQCQVVLLSLLNAYDTSSDMDDLHSTTAEQWDQYSHFLNASLANYEQLLCSWDGSRGYAVNKQQFIDDAYDELLTCITTAAKLCIRTKHISYTAQNWWSDKSTTSIPQLYSAMRSAAIALNDDPHDVQLKQHERQCKSAFRHAVAAAKYESWKSFCSKVEDVEHSKLLWSVWHQSLGSAKSPLNSIPNAHDQLPASPTESLTNMCVAFASISTLPSPTSPEAIANDHYVNTYVNVMRDAYGQGYVPAHDVLDTPFSSYEIQQSARSIRCNTATGPDGIHARFIKHGGSQLHKAMSVLFQYSWQYGVVPTQWRMANVCTIYKGEGERASAASYRPISITSVVIRFFERLILRRIWRVVEPQIPAGTNAANIPAELRSRISASQAGFRNGFCTLDHLLSCRFTLDRVYEQGGELPVAFIDIAKAYDKTWKAGVLLKCHRMGIYGRCWRWLDALLHGRRMRVGSHQHHSDWHDVPEGLPQGSVLVPLLFLIFINDVIGGRTDVHEQLFADDMMAHPLAHDGSDASCHVLQSILDGYTRWADLWK